MTPGAGADHTPMFRLRAEKAAAVSEETWAGEQLKGGGGEGILSEIWTYSRFYCVLGSFDHLKGPFLIWFEAIQHINLYGQARAQTHKNDILDFGLRIFVSILIIENN